MNRGRPGIVPITTKLLTLAEQRAGVRQHQFCQFAVLPSSVAA